MTNQIVLDKKQFLSARKIISIAAFAAICLCFLFLLFGFIPFRGRNLALIAAINQAFEFIYLGTKPFWYCCSCVTFAGLYIFMFVRCTISIIGSLKRIKLWLLSDEDSKKTRAATRYVIASANMIIGILFCIFAASYVMSDFSLSAGTIFGLIVLVLLQALINAASNLLFTQNLSDSVISALSNALILASIVLLATMSPSVQLLDSFGSILPFFNTLGTDSMVDRLAFQMLAQKILMPIFYFCFLASLMRLYFHVNEDDVNGFSFMRTTIIRNSILLGILMVLIGYANQYDQLGDYLAILFSHLIFILISGLVCVCAINTKQDASEISYFKEDDPNLPEAPNPQTIPSEQEPSSPAEPSSDAEAPAAEIE